MIGQFIFAGMLLIQIVSYGVAAYALFRDATQTASRPTVPLHSWLLPALSPTRTATIAFVFWLLATIGFVATAMSFTGTLLPEPLWQQLAIITCLVATVGIVLFSGIWPGAPSRKFTKIDTVIALVLNAAIFVSALVGWPG